jgi:hypothetical protein
MTTRDEALRCAIRGFPRSPEAETAGLAKERGRLFDDMLRSGTTRALRIGNKTFPALRGLEGSVHFQEEEAANMTSQLSRVQTRHVDVRANSRVSVDFTRARSGA